MRTSGLNRGVAGWLRRFAGMFMLGAAFYSGPTVWSTGTVEAASLRVMTTGLGQGTIGSTTGVISCGSTCDATLPDADTVVLTVTPGPGSTFLGWGGDCTGSGTCSVSMNVVRSVRAEFGLSTAIPSLSACQTTPPAGTCRPEDIQTFLAANPAVTSAARFLKALPIEYKQNWILMPRSESLQTGTADAPRILMPSASARFVFTIGMKQHSSYPGAHPNAIEFMQWDATQKNFRFHEIVLDSIPALDPDGDGVGVIPARSRGVSIDDAKCFSCHSTRNILNRGTTAGTTGIQPGTVQYKSKPNWDTYDSWGGMLAFNRDRIYQGSAEAGMFRQLFNMWTWRSSPDVRSILEQLELQPPNVPDGTGGGSDHRITRLSAGGANDGLIRFGFDPPLPASPVTTEPFPAGGDPGISTNYRFDARPGSGTATPVVRGGAFVTLHQSTQPTSDEGRGVELFDRLSFEPNPQRIADEIINHRFATGGVVVDVRPIALAIAQGCIAVGGGTDRTATQTITSTPALSAASMTALSFFNTRHTVSSFDQLFDDTQIRAFSLPRRKADIQKSTLDRTGDPYVSSPDAVNGVIQQYGAGTSGISGGSGGLDISLARLRQEVFRRPIDVQAPDRTVMGGILVDRELANNSAPLALYRYFLEPLGVSVDKWSMGVRGRSRTYTFADLFGQYTSAFATELKTSLGISLSLPSTDVCNLVIPMVNTTLSALPPANGLPTYTDVQRIFNKSCIECHGGLDYPPYSNYGSSLDLSENEAPAAGQDRLDRSHDLLLSGFVTSDPRTSFLYQRICPGASSLPDVNTPCPLPPSSGDNESCPYGVMPCGGPRLSNADIETVRRWIVGPPPTANTRGDPHIRTIDGVNYDFQAAGEFVLLRGRGVEVQARQTAVSTAAPLGPNNHTGLTSCVSINTAAAVRVGNHRITYQPNLSGKPDPEGLQLRVDGKLTSLVGGELLLPSGGRIVRTTAPGGIQIQAPGGASVVLTPGWWDYHKLWFMNIDTSHVRATDGLMGAIASGSWLPALPDGASVGAKPANLNDRYKVLYGRFGNAWRVTNASTLFDYSPGTSTATFAMTSWPRGESPQSCMLPPLSEGVPAKPPAMLATEVAQKHCSGIVAADARENCEQDVRVTGAPEFANIYKAAEKIARNAAPTAPQLDFPEGFRTDLTLPVRFAWGAATDADGDPLTYRHCVWNVKDRFTYKHCTTDSIQPTSWLDGLRCALIVLLIGLVILAILYVLWFRKKPAALVATVLVVLAATALAFFLCAGKVQTKSLTELKSGESYFWKVMVEDGNGGFVESETRRFAVK